VLYLTGTEILRIVRTIKKDGAGVTATWNFEETQWSAF